MPNENEAAEQAFAALVAARTYLEARDRMNAAVHCELPHWSPLTLKVSSAIGALVEAFLFSDPEEGSR